MKITRDPTPKGNNSLKLTAYALAMNPNNVPILLERLTNQDLRPMSAMPKFRIVSEQQT